MVSEMIPCISFNTMQFDAIRTLSASCKTQIPELLSGSDVSYIIAILLLFCIEIASRPQA